MALILSDRVKETCSSPGTGSVSLLGAQTGFQAFSTGVGNGNTCYYTIADQSGTHWEVGIGTYSSTGNTLTRTTPLSGSATTPVNFSSGTQDVFVTYPAEKAVYTDANGNISNLAGGISTPTFIQFATNATPTPSTGMVWWDGGTSLNMQMDANVVGQLCEDSFMYVKASSAISMGNLVMFNGTDGASGHVLAIPATGVTVPEYIIGVAAEPISSGSFGLVQILGHLMGLDTSGSSVGETWVNGDILYYNSAYAGGMTHTFPSSGPIITIAAVVYAHSGTQGSILVRPSFNQRITATSPLSNTQSSSGSSLSISQANTSTNGYLSSTDWNTFNNKQPSGTYVTSVTGTAPVVSSGGTTPAISMPVATSSANGYLASTDWTTFNNKSPAAGSTSITTLGTITTGTWNATTLGVAYGGTGLTSLTAGYIPYGNGTSAFSSSSALTFDGTTLSATKFAGALNGTVGATTANTGAFTSLSATGYLQLGADYGSSAVKFGTNGSFIGRQSSDGSLIIDTGQASIIFASGSTSGYSSLASINGSTGLFSLPFQTQCGNDYTSSSFQIGNQGSYLGRDSSDGSTKLYTAQASIRFGSSGTEWMRINSSGGVSIGNTTDPGAKNLSVSGLVYVNTTSLPTNLGAGEIVVAGSVNTNCIAQQAPSSSGNYFFQDFVCGTTEVGFIRSSNGTTLNYTSISDYRLKENIQPMTEALAKVQTLKPVTYTWKKDGSDGQGFIAHELQAVVPECVSGEKDAVDDKGNPIYQGIDTSHLVATLTAAIQELNAKFDAYIASHP